MMTDKLIAYVREPPRIESKIKNDNKMVITITKVEKVVSEDAELNLPDLLAFYELSKI